jgi:hypothetical protein
MTANDIGYSATKWRHAKKPYPAARFRGKMQSQYAEVPEDYIAPFQQLDQGAGSRGSAIEAM